MACGGRAPAVLGKALAKTLLNDLIAPEIHSRVLQIPVQREKRFLQERDRIARAAAEALLNEEELAAAKPADKGGEPAAGAGKGKVKRKGSGGAKQKPAAAAANPAGAQSDPAPAEAASSRRTGSAAGVDAALVRAQEREKEQREAQRRAREEDREAALQARARELGFGAGGAAEEAEGDAVPEHLAKESAIRLDDDGWQIPTEESAEPSAAEPWARGSSGDGGWPSAVSGTPAVRAGWPAAGAQHAEPPPPRNASSASGAEGRGKAHEATSALASLRLGTPAARDALPRPAAAQAEPAPAAVPLFLQSFVGAPAPSVAQPPAALPPWLSASSPAPAPAAASAYSAPWAPAPVQPAVAAGLANSVGENNCFLNVVLQSLFGCERFSRRLLLDAGDHRCGGRPEKCVTCGIVAVFTQMSTGGVADPGVLRRALDSAFQHTDLFRLSQMNDASETLHEIFNCLHRAFSATAPAAPTAASRKKDRGGKYEVDVTGQSMILDILGLDVYESLACRACRKATRKLRFTQLFHLAAVTPLTVLAATAAAGSGQRPTLGSLLRMVEEQDARSCDKDEKGCGLVQPLHRKLREVPPLFTLILAWESGAADAAAISSLLDVLETSLRVEEAYSAVERDTPVRSRTHHLRSMVAYYGAHYAAFVYSSELGAWRYVDDASVRVVGSWDDVKAQCERGRLQPLALFFEAK